MNTEFSCVNLFCDLKLYEDGMVKENWIIGKEKGSSPVRALLQVCRKFGIK
jgi:hypothetical protein